MKRGDIVRCEFAFIIPVDASLDQVEEWANFQFGRGGCDLANPLLNSDWEVHSDVFVEATGSHNDYLDRRDARLAAALRNMKAKSDD